MNEIHRFQVSISCWRVKTISINVHKTPVEYSILNTQWHPVDDHRAITTASTRFFLC